MFHSSAFVVDVHIVFLVNIIPFCKASYFSVIPDKFLKILHFLLILRNAKHSLVSPVFGESNVVLWKIAPEMVHLQSIFFLPTGKLDYPV